ncbi:UNVERIFIED_CONTAM: hypothetical protein Sangu_1517300 [Sesamum angustifolium]|uniref:Uncharacterized protein n=1 Tax=Sesamum angustifolium TaxID=2727405 RepID=A0AAW2MU91_9LAMI
MAESNPVLLGPPEIYQESAATAPVEEKKINTANSDPFVDLMVENFNRTVFSSNPMMGLTENLSPTFFTTGDPCLDFFFHVVPDTPPETLIYRLELAWSRDPLKALKLVCNLRGVRGTGKSDKEGFYTAALWLHKHHPKTLAGNLDSLANFGYFKDLPEILYRLLEGADARKIAKEMWMKRKRGRKGRRRGSGVERNEKTEKTEQKSSREEKKIARAKRVVERFNRDFDFVFLHDRVSDLFAQYLKSDLKMLNSGDVYKISLAAKWCPSLDSSFDKMTLLCETIARKMFPREEYPEYEGIEAAHYAYRVRDRLRKQVLVPLRKSLELPEVFIGANKWGSIPYSRVASVAMKFYKEKFLKHDKERFEEYLEKVKSGKAKIAAGALLPHEIITSLYDADGGQVAELQWKRIVDDMARKGKLNNCLAVSDVSGSMSGIPMNVAIALGMLVSELCEEPWKGKIITFSSDPKLHAIEGDSLREKSEFVRCMDFGLSTNFQKVFDVILEVAVKGNLPTDRMIKRLFVFSDMEFDQASEVPWETDYQAIVRKFTEKGYGDCIPEIVFWNLRDSRATPVPGNQPGVALVSGFSKNLMTLFLEEGGILNPEAVMDIAISGEEYQKLVCARLVIN